MRHFDPDDETDCEELDRLNAAPWQVALLAMNPDYCCWGPHEDYMWKRGPDEGPDEFGRVGEASWSARILAKSWAECDIELDDLNEVVNFYFELARENVSCETCGGNGYHPDAQWISESFYSHSSPFKAQTVRERESSLMLAAFGDRLPRETIHGQHYGNFPSDDVLAKYPAAFRQFCAEMQDGDHCWHDKITQDECSALVESGRLCDLTSEFVPGEGWRKKDGVRVTAAEVNKLQNRKGAGLLGHDAINRSILVRARCKRLGVPLECPRCEGHGYQFTKPAAHVNLVFWLLHPRKGCSRGVEVANIQEAELPEVFAFLRTAAARNAARFSKIPNA